MATGSQLTSSPVNCCWPSSAQRFLVPSRTGFVIIFYFLTALEIFRPLNSESYSLGTERIENAVCNSSCRCVLNRCWGTVITGPCPAMAPFWLSSHCSLLKAVRPEQPIGVYPFLLLRGDVSLTSVIGLANGNSTLCCSCHFFRFRRRSAFLPRGLGLVLLFSHF
jgi:hypothetical protein